MIKHESLQFIILLESLQYKIFLIYIALYVILNRTLTMHTILNYKPKLVDIFYKDKQNSNHKGNISKLDKANTIPKNIHQRQKQLETLNQTSKYNSNSNASNCTSLYQPSQLSPVAQRFQNVILKQNWELKKFIENLQKKTIEIDLKIKEVTAQFINQMKFYKLPKKADSLIQNFLIQILQQTQMLLQTGNFSASLRSNHQDALKSHNTSFDQLSQAQLNRVHVKKTMAKSYKAIQQQQRDLQSTIRGQNKLDQIVKEVNQSLTKRNISQVIGSSQRSLEDQQSDIQSQGFQQKNTKSKFQSNSHLRFESQSHRKSHIQQKCYNFIQQGQTSHLSRTFWQNKYGENIQYSQVISRKKIFQQK